MPQIDLFDNIRLTETVYIYQKHTPSFYTKKFIKELFMRLKKARADDQGKRLFEFVNRSIVSNAKQVKLSGLVLRFHAMATFINEYVAGWEEVKLSYLFVIDLGDHVIISKRNVADISSFTDQLKPLPYEVIANMLYSPTSLIESYGMENMDTSSSAMRSRKVEAENLRETFNYNGANTYVLNFIRLHNDRDRFAIALNTSRLSKSGERSALLRLVDSATQLVKAAEDYKASDTPLNVFAKFNDYEQMRDQITPISVTLTFSKLLEDVENGVIQGFQFEYKFRRRRLNLQRFIRSLTKYIELEPSRRDYVYEAAAGTPSIFADIIVKLNRKNIRFYSTRLSQIRIVRNAGPSNSLVSYLNEKNGFFVAFEQSAFRYYNRALFEDGKLLGAIPQFLSYFEPIAGLGTVVNEKGNFRNGMTRFDTNSSFHLAEQQFRRAQYMVLDDLGGEWADHIVLDQNEIVFVHSKADTSIFSATAFTEIVGQAQKNMGSMNATAYTINQKKGFWKSVYRNNSAITRISRLRRGATIDQFADRFVELTVDINCRKKVVLNVNFISKASLILHLQNLVNGVPTRETKQAIQILWQISSLISSCYQHNVGLSIWCKP